jgi:hypothetical protein
VESTSGQLLDNLKDNLRDTSNHLEDWVKTKPSGQGDSKPVASSYCYYALQDIVCYRQPMPGWEHRLVAYQGTDAKEPPSAMMEPLPKRASENNSDKPEVKAANSQPVFATMPKESTDKPDTSDQKGNSVPVPEAVHEQLPNPALSPEL